MLSSIGKKRAATAVFTLGAAIGAGYIMQNSMNQGGPTALAGPKSIQMASSAMSNQAVAPQLPAESVAPVLAEVMRAESLPVLSSSPVAGLTAPPREAPVLLASADETQLMPMANAEPNLVEVAPAAKVCEVGFTAMAAPGAMVELTLEAPCYAGQSVVFDHAGLRFSETLDQGGLAQIPVPALQENAVFTATFADQRQESVESLMLTVSDYERVALAWQGDAGFEIQAFENDADFGEIGHVHADAPGDPAQSVAGDSGFLVALGGEGGFAGVVYSYPAFLTDLRPDPEITIEAAVSVHNCGTSISGTFLRVDPDGAPEVTDVAMVVPQCEALGEHLVLKIPAQDRRIARN